MVLREKYVRFLSSKVAHSVQVPVCIKCTLKTKINSFSIDYILRTAVVQNVVCPVGIFLQRKQ